MELPLESVPNFSEGRDATTIEALRTALARRARVLDVHVDPDHNRSVFTLVGSEAELADALVDAIGQARALIDLRAHEGVHPRVGAADVVPLVPIEPADMPRAQATARVVARRIGEELGLPVFLYAESGAGRRPAFFRQGGLDALQARIATGELVPDFGPARLDPTAGAVLVGARRPLVAFNVNLAGDDVEAARAIAAVVREAGGGFTGVRALGLALPRAGHVQVSMNVEDAAAAPLAAIVERIQAEAATRGMRVLGSELVGLVPAAAVVAAARGALGLVDLEPADVLELRLLEDLPPGRRA